MNVIIEYICGYVLLFNHISMIVLNYGHTVKVWVDFHNIRINLQSLFFPHTDYAKLPYFGSFGVYHIFQYRLYLIYFAATVKIIFYLILKYTELI
jgi:hypothetical protein